MSNKRVTNLFAEIAARDLPNLPDPWPGIRLRIVSGAVSQQADTSHGWQRVGDARWRAGFVVAALLLVSLGINLWQSVARPQPVSAQAVLRAAASQTPANLAAHGVHSFHSTMTITWTDERPSRAGATVIATQQTWGVTPDRWRVEFRSRHVPETDPPISLGAGSDGTTEWSSSVLGTTPQVRIGAARPEDVVPAFTRLDVTSGNGVPLSVTDALQCYQPTLVGEDVVAGRAAYIIDLGPEQCPAATVTTGGRNATTDPALPDQQRRQRVWIDKQTFFWLKGEQRTLDGTVIRRSEVTQIEYNVPIAQDVFTFVPSPGSAITDLRPG